MTKAEKFIEQHLLALTKKNTSQIPLAELKSIQGISQRQVLRAILKMICNEKITIQPTKRDRENLSVVLGQTCRVYKVSLKEFHAVCQCIEAYYFLEHSDELKDFLDCLPAKAKQWAILNFIKQNEASLLDLKIICRWVTAYWSGHSPLPLSEMGLSAEETVWIHMEISANRFFPVHQELVDIKAERSTYYLSGVLRPRMIELTLNKPIPKVERNIQQAKGLFLERTANDIEQKELFFNREENILFSEMYHLAKKVGPDSNNMLTLLLHGVSGTGKTEFAYQLARQLGGGLLQLNFPEIQSKYIGETEKNLQKVFEMYHRLRVERCQPLILLINEADGIMNSRVKINISNDAFHNQTQTVMLELLENSSGIIIATTNQIQNIDHAFNRRFMFKQEIRLPQREARVSIIKNLKCTQYMSQDIIELLENNEWCPGSLAIFMNRIKRLSEFKKLYEIDILAMLRNEGMLSPKCRIGFRFNQNITI